MCPFMNRIFFFWLISALFFWQIANAQNIRINEVMLGNSTSIQDENGEEYSWIEIYNSGADSVNLAGYYLSDNPSSPFKWRFEEYWIKSQEYLIVMASERNLQAGPVSPIATGHLQSWFRASDVDTANTTQVNRVNGEYFVKKWMSYNNLHNATQTTTTKQPKLEFSSINGLKALRFNGTSQMLISNVVPPTGNLPRSMMVVLGNTRVISANQSTNNHICQYGTSSTGLSYGLTFQKKQFNNKIGANYWTTSFYGMGVLDSSKHIISQVYTPGTDNFYLDGVFAGTNYINLNTGSTNALRIASRNGSGAEYYGGDIAEILVFDTALSESKRRQVENYIARIYGLPTYTFHTNFKLSSSGETILLTMPDSTTLHQLVVPGMRDDLSYGYSGDSLAYFTQATPGEANTTTPFNSVMNPPELSVAQGFYSESFNLGISADDPEATILYTLDGSDPDTSAIGGTTFDVKYTYPGCNTGAMGLRTSNTYVYQDSLPITPKYNAPRDRANIQSAFQGWNSSTNLYKQATVVRAAVWKSNAILSPIVTRTYFVDSAATNRFHLPIVSVVMPDYQLFDYDTGIYVPGEYYDQTCSTANPQGNFDRDEERASHFELFTQEGQLLYRQNGGARIHGNYSTNWPRKSFRYEARGRYENGQFEYPLFPGLRAYPEAGGGLIEEYNAFIVRNSGNNCDNNLFRDAMMHRLVNHLHTDGQHSRAVVHFINGEYWGIMNLREKHDEFYFASHYNMNDEDVIIANARTASISSGYPYEYQHYSNLENYVNANSLAVQANYDYVDTQMDIENYSVHFMVEIFLNNTDFLGNNRKFWRKRTPSYIPGAPFGQDGRWRWILYDLDQGFANPSYDRLTPTTTGTDISTRILRKLLDNTEFKYDFINSFCDQMNTSFVPARMISVIDSMKQQMDPDIAEHILRWPGQINSTQGYAALVDFAQKRPIYMRRHLKTRFTLSDSCVINLQTNQEHGKIKINSIKIDQNTIGLTNPAQPYPWAGIYFRGIPIDLVAIPGEGYTFSHWEGVEGGSSDTITVTPAGDLTIIAHFIPIPVPDYDLVHFWLFDNSIVNDTPLDTLNAVYSLTGGALLRFHSALNGYPFDPLHPNWRKASMERRNAPTPINYRPEGNNNLPYGSFTMRAIQIKQPFTGDGGENTICFEAPTTGYEDIKFTFAAKNELAADGMTVEYSVTDPPVWTTAGLTNSTLPLTSDFQLFTVDFANIPTADENPDFQVRLRFYGSNMSADLGNRVTFNNVAIDGVSTYVPSDFYSKATGDLNVLSTWGANPDGSGTAPQNFSNENTVYHLQNRTEATLTYPWSVTGTGSKIVVGNGILPATLIVEDDLDATVDVATGSMLHLKEVTSPVIGTLEPGSTVKFSDAAQSIPYRTYSNLIFSGITPAFTGTGTVTIQGDMTLEGAVPMPDARGASLYSLLFSGDSVQTINTGTNILRSYNTTFIKSAGAISFTPGSRMSCDNQFASTIGPAASFSDNGITIYSGNSVNIGGTGASYNFTGTLILAGTEAGIVKGAGAGNNFNVRDADATNKNAVAALNNLIIRVANTGGEFRLRDGTTNTFTIKGDLAVESGAAGRIRFYANDLLIGGDLIIGDGFAGTLDAIKSVNFNGSGEQNISNALAVNLTSLYVSNTSGLVTMDGIFDVAQLLQFNSGILKTSANGLVKLGLTSQITGTGTSKYVEGNLGRRANATTPMVLTYPMGIDNQYLPFAFEVSHTGVTENLYIGSISLSGVAKMSLSEEIEYLAGNQRYSLTSSGANTIQTGKVTLPFDPGALGFDTQWLRVAGSSPGGWINLGGLVDGSTVSSVNNIIETSIYALAKAAEPHVVPDTLALQNMTVGEFTDTCFAAVDKIIVAGDETLFEVTGNGSVNLVAGQRIFFFPHTIVSSGGYLHAWIDETGNYCNQAPALPSVTQTPDFIAEPDAPESSQEQLSLIIFPNPTSGLFSLKAGVYFDGTNSSAEVYTLLGEKIFSVSLDGQKSSVFDLSNYPAGVYLVRVISATGSGYTKIVKR